jgi:hypothetical protein
MGYGQVGEALGGGFLGMVEWSSDDEMESRIPDKYSHWGKSGGQPEAGFDPSSQNGHGTFPMIAEANLHGSLRPNLDVGSCKCTRGGTNPKGRMGSALDGFKMGKAAAGGKTWQPASAGS